MVPPGWFARGTSPMLVRFVPGVSGYLWLFPRPDHVGVGICAPLTWTPTRQMLSRLESVAARDFPALLELDSRRYAHTIPSPSADPRCLLEIAGDGWGPGRRRRGPRRSITRRGDLLRAPLLGAPGRDPPSPTARPLAIPSGALADFGADLLKAAALRDRFYSPGFSSRMIRFGASSPAIREILADLVLGRQGYVGLKRRLLRAAPRFAWEATKSRLFAA